MKPLTPRQKTLIVNNVLAACKDIEKLNRTGYGFLYLASGFIAHYNLGGFRAHYSERSLSAEILRNHRANSWANFRPGDKNYEYYKSKAEVYKKITDRLMGFPA